MTNRWVLAALIAGGCGGSTAPEQAAPATPTPTIADPAPRAEPPEVDPACMGKDLDLATLIAGTTCASTGAAKPPPPGAIRLSVSPAPLDVKAGEPKPVRVYFLNSTTDPVVFDLGLDCDPAMGFRAQVKVGDKTVGIPAGDANAVEAWSSWCAKVARCAQRQIRIGLPPSGRAAMPLDVHARARGLDADCNKTAGAPLAAGEYVLEIEVPWDGDAGVAIGTLRVQQ